MKNIFKDGNKTKEHLERNGWIETGNEYCPFEKKIENRNPINDNPEDTDVKLVIHRLFNVWMFAIALPNGGLLNLNISSLDDLDKLYSMINFYDCPY